MHSQVALLLQDAFLQAEDFSIPGIGSFSQKKRSDSSGVEIVFDTNESKAPSLATYWEKDLKISAAEAAQKLSELRVAIRWGLQTHGHFMIPEVGTLHQHQPGKLQFHSLIQAQEEVPPVATPEPEQVAPPLEATSSKRFSNRTISYVLVGIFGLIGLIIIGQAIWGGDGIEAQSDATQKAQQTGRLAAEAGEKKPQLAHAANYNHTETQVDSPLKPLDKSQIVSTSRPQDGGITSSNPASSPASIISAREASTETGSTLRTDEQEDKAIVDIGVLDTLNGTSGNLANARIASRGSSGSNPAPTTEARNQFHLIAGSFANYEAAQTFADEMRAQGSEPVILPANAQSHMQYRVSIFHHPTREEVVKQKQILMQAGKKAGWIYAPQAASSSF